MHRHRSLVVVAFTESPIGNRDRAGDGEDGGYGGAIGSAAPVDRRPALRQS